MSLADHRLWRDPACRLGMKDMAAVAPGMAAWGVVTGVAMVKGGLPLGVALLMAVTVYSAGAQLAAMPLMLAGAPWPVIWLTAGCVNLRFVIFSLQMRPHMMVLRKPWRVLAGYLTADLSYVLTHQRYGQGPPAGPERLEPLAYFCGVALVNWASWNVAIVLGIAFASVIPTDWGLGFAGTLALLGLLVTLIQDRFSLFTVALAAGAAVAAFALPFKLHIVVSVAAAVTAALMMDRWRRTQVQEAG